MEDRQYGHVPEGLLLNTLCDGGEQSDPAAWTVHC